MINTKKKRFGVAQIRYFPVLIITIIRYDLTTNTPKSPNSQLCAPMQRRSLIHTINLSGALRTARAQRKTRPPALEAHGSTRAFAAPQRTN